MSWLKKLRGDGDDDNNELRHLSYKFPHHSHYKFPHHSHCNYQIINEKKKKKKTSNIILCLK